MSQPAKLNPLGLVVALVVSVEQDLPHMPDAMLLVCMYACMHACMYVCMYGCISNIYIYIYMLAPPPHDPPLGGEWGGGG